MQVLHVVGARPNFMKVAPVMKALNQREGIRQYLVHTGQHYDANMSEIFFRQLEIPEPNIDLEVGSGSHAQQTAQIISRFEMVVLEQKPDMVVVYGDVNSTVAAALVCAKLGIQVAHVEAGLRSFDQTMPEEINRLLTDKIARFLFTPSIDGNENLVREGVAREKIHLVGNVMIDTLVRLLPRADIRAFHELASFDLVKNPYILLTLHRPSNVDNPDMLINIISALNEISHDLPIVFPIHPRTRQRLQNLNITINNRRFFLIEPIGYLPFLALQQRAKVVVTDSGGIQEETTFLGIPCLTVRENTERPVTVTMGTNILIGRDMKKLKKEINLISSGETKKGTVPPLWDGKASERIADIIEKQK